MFDSHSRAALVWPGYVSTIVSGTVLKMRIIKYLGPAQCGSGQHNSVKRVHVSDTVSVLADSASTLQLHQLLILNWIPREAIAV